MISVFVFSTGGGHPLFLLSQSQTGDWLCSHGFLTWGDGSDHILLATEEKSDSGWTHDIRLVVLRHWNDLTLLRCFLTWHRDLVLSQSYMSICLSINVGDKAGVSSGYNCTYCWGHLCLAPGSKGRSFQCNRMVLANFCSWLFFVAPPFEKSKNISIESHVFCSFTSTSQKISSLFLSTTISNKFNYLSAMKFLEARESLWISFACFGMYLPSGFNFVNFSGHFVELFERNHYYSSTSLLRYLGKAKIKAEA